MPGQKKDDGNIWLIGAGILATVIGAAGTFMMSSNNNNNGNRKSVASPPKKAGCGCGKH